MIITEYGKLIRVHANEIREAGRSTRASVVAPRRRRQNRSRRIDPEEPEVVEEKT